MTDPIADMIIRIKNALLVRKAEVEIPFSKMKQSIATILKEENYIEEIEVKPTTPQATLVLKLKYVGRTPAITDVKRLSKPGRRMYATVDQIPQSLGGYGLTLVSTSKGVMTATKARQLNVGGEVLCQIW
ncbi:MAG TPA: 30S ribosomal protein S8 [Vitreimonas sp.]|nr:30S ribosomal protein S8 [Vitreimonas sp.]